MPDTTYAIKLRGSGVPIEIAELIDGIETGRNIHSDIDKKVRGIIERSSTLVTINGGQDSDKQIAYISYTTTTSGVALELDIISHALGSITTLVIAITAAGSSGTPDCEISLDGSNYDMLLKGVGDHTVIQADNIAGDNIKLKSSGATKVAVVDILVMYESIYLRDSGSVYLRDSGGVFLRVGNN